MTRKKQIFYTLSTIIVVGVAIWCKLRWRAWFDNPPEEPYIAASVPSRVLLTFGNEGALSRNISWQCDSVVHPSYIEIQTGTDTTTLCIPADGEVFASRSGKAAYYVARIEKVMPDVRYRYRAVTNGKFSPWYAFTARDVGAEGNFSFLYFGDVQDSIGGIAHQQIMKAWRAHPDVDFVSFGGDLTERPTDRYWKETFRDLDTIGQTLPVLCITGNHEYLKYPIRRLERRFSLVFSYFLDSMIGENQVFTLQVGNTRLYLLDSDREWPYLMNQRKWLSQQFAENTARWNIVMLHHPIYSIKSPSNNLTQRWSFADLINQHADLVLQGHEHAYARMTLHQNGRAVPPIYTVSHCSPKHYRFRFDKKFDRFGCGTQFYQYVALHGDTLTMKAYDAATEQLYDQVDIVKGVHDKAHILDKGKEIPEILIFHPAPGNAKDEAFAQRIRDYQKLKKMQ